MQDKEIQKPNLSSSTQINFIYTNKDNKYFAVDIDLQSFQKLPAEDRLLLISANFQSVKFIGVSVRESILKPVKLNKDEKIDDSVFEELICIDEREVSLTTRGEDRLEEVLSSIKPQVNNVGKSKPKKLPTKSHITPGESDKNYNPRKNENIYELLEDVKQILREKGCGITPSDGKSVTEQFNNICTTLLGASAEDTNSAYLALRNDPEIIKISFEPSYGTKRYVSYLGLLELEDDPLTRAQHAVNNLRDMVDGYVCVLRDYSMALDPKIREYKVLCEKMSQTDWVKHEYGELEQYTTSLMQALSYVATQTRSTKMSRTALS